ncbi:hypothetical protein E2C01_015417 [Portunus trituberculatus]|uniref:Uncharacterized protein n=1 Tax=Portunus trituberculatus TaxID=210409 RepID=A0A5B7DMX9_PORTR|nr:hypothetical protein [Portunus trituberculatus]
MARQRCGGPVWCGAVAAHLNAVFVYVYGGLLYYSHCDVVVAVVIVNFVTHITEFWSVEVSSVVFEDQGPKQQQQKQQQQQQQQP